MVDSALTEFLSMYIFIKQIKERNLLGFFLYFVLIRESVFVYGFKQPFSGQVAIYNLLLKFSSNEIDKILQTPFSVLRLFYLWSYDSLVNHNLTLRKEFREYINKCSGLLVNVFSVAESNRNFRLAR